MPGAAIVPGGTPAWRSSTAIATQGLQPATTGPWRNGRRTGRFAEATLGALTHRLLQFCGGDMPIGSCWLYNLLLHQHWLQLQEPQRAALQLLLRAMLFGYVGHGDSGMRLYCCSTAVAPLLVKPLVLGSSAPPPAGTAPAPSLAGAPTATAAAAGTRRAAVAEGLTAWNAQAAAPIP
jgi:hypothetical protein